MLKDSHAFSGFSVTDLDQAQKFYGETLGLDVTVDKMGMQLRLGGDTTIFVYPKEDHVPASFTILNFPVVDIDKTVDELAAQGVEIEHYELGFAEQDEKGILRGRAANMGPDIAWFKDPSGNILSVLQD